MNRKNQRHNTFRFPFDINPRVFIVLAVIFFIFSIKQVSDFFFPKVSLQSQAAKIEKDISKKIAHFEKHYANGVVFEKAWNDSLTPSAHKQLMKLSYHLILLKKNELIFWNSTQFEPPADSIPEKVPVGYKNKNGFYVLYAMQYGKQKENKAIIAIPVKKQSLFEGEYIRNYFPTGDSENDFGIEVSLSQQKGGIPIRFGNRTLLYLYQNPADLFVFDKNGFHLFFNALPFIFFGISIHTFFKVIVKKYKPILIFICLCSTALLVRSLGYFFSFPDDFSAYSLFDPAYFHRNCIQRSVGDVFINMCLWFWFLLFFAVNVQGRILHLSTSIKKYVFATVVMIICVVLHIYLVGTLHSLVMDSKINFDTTLISKLDLFSFVGILILLVIFANMFLLSLIANNYLNQCFKPNYIKYGLLALITAVIWYVYATESSEINYFYYGVWAAVVFAMLDYTTSRIKFDFNSIFLIVWIVTVSISGSIFLSDVIIKKEQKVRASLAETIAMERESSTENMLSTLKVKIASDPVILKSLLEDSTVNSSKIADYIYLQYFNKHLNRYKLDIAVFNSDGSNTEPNETLHLNRFYQYLNMQCERSEADSSTFFCEADDVVYYHTIYNFGEDRPNKKFVVLTLKKSLSIFDQNNTDFILYEGFNSDFRENKYSLAIYKDKTIVTRKGVFQFLSNIDPGQIFKDGQLKFVSKNGNSEMWYHLPQLNKTIVIIKQINTFYLITTLFAYIFLIYFSTISLYILGNIVARSNLNRKRFFNLLSLNLRLKIQLSILTMILLSFAAVGYFTSKYFSSRIMEKSRIEISDYGQMVQNELTQFFRDNNYLTTDINNRQNKNYIISLIEKLANRFSVSLSLYDPVSGKLIFSTQPDLFRSGVFSNWIPQAAFYKLKEGNYEHFIGQENIGSFNFLASYSYIKNLNGNAIAIIQLPYILSNYEIKSETNSVIVTLVNIYVFVFLISSLVALFISNSVSRPFKYIVKQFTKINLNKTNEPLKWNSSDEIGMLVIEYNRMLRKLENSTVLLAKNEREMAWREMARQVAHEIKNPLTPMKLSLQMLERAIKTKKPNVTEMTSRVTNTLIEQIDNLTLIATNFSDFAKMPDLKWEKVILNEVLYTVTGMYNDNAESEFLFLIPDYPITIKADKGQLIRVFINIVQNAIQAIPGNKKGNISLVVSKIKNNFIRISISDNGEGISAEKAKKLFQPYFTTKTSGTGLGLAMCKDMVEQFGGRIDFESVVNEGTTFHIDLPILEDEESTT